jgi:hypothetical protein
MSRNTCLLYSTFTYVCFHSDVWPSYMVSSVIFDLLLAKCDYKLRDLKYLQKIIIFRITSDLWNASLLHLECLIIIHYFLQS